MRYRNPLITTQLQSGRSIERGLIAFHFGSGIYRFIKDIEPREWPIGSGNIWQPGGILKIDNFINSIGFSASTFNVILAASPDDGLTPDVLKTIWQEDTRGRLVEVYDLYIDPNTGVAVGADLKARRFVKNVKQKTSAELGDYLQMQCITKTVNYGKSNGRLANDEDQQRRAPGDGFLKSAATVGRIDTAWGRKKV